MNSGRNAKYGGHGLKKMAMMEHQGVRRRVDCRVDWRDEKKKRMEGKEGMEGLMESICWGSCASSCFASVRKAASASGCLPTSLPHLDLPPNPRWGLLHPPDPSQHPPPHSSLPAVLPRTQPRPIPAFKTGRRVNGLCK